MNDVNLLKGVDVCFMTQHTVHFIKCALKKVFSVIVGYDVN